ACGFWCQRGDAHGVLPVEMTQTVPSLAAAAGLAADHVLRPFDDHRPDCSDLMPDYSDVMKLLK
ncbi:MAG: hypothetical protein ACE5DS_03310, partial [Kiloniellaceae bacterium]